MAIISNPLLISTEGQVSFSSGQYETLPYLALSTSGWFSTLTTEEITAVYRLCLEDLNLLNKLY